MNTYILYYQCLESETGKKVGLVGICKKRVMDEMDQMLLHFDTIFSKFIVKILNQIKINGLLVF